MMFSGSSMKCKTSVIKLCVSVGKALENLQALHGGGGASLPLCISPWPQVIGNRSMWM